MKFELPTFRTAFLTGMLVLAPVVVTGWVFISLFRLVDGLIKPWLLKIPYLSELLPPSGLTGIGFLAAVVLVTLVGLLSNNLMGRWFIGTFDRIIARIPWIKGIYNASKELSGVIFAERSRAFRKVVLFEYPRQGLWSLGFVTREVDDLPEDVMLHVFLPTTPNPTSGYFLMVPRKDAIQLAMSIEEGVKLVVSGGAVISDENRRRLIADLHERRSS